MYTNDVELYLPSIRNHNTFYVIKVSVSRANSIALLLSLFLNQLSKLSNASLLNI